MSKIKSQNKRIIILSVSFLLLAGLIVIFTQPAKIKSYPYEPGNVEIVVGKNQDGEQSPNAGVQTDVMKNMGAATIDDITGESGNPLNQGQGLEEILKDKNIDVQK